MQMFIDGNMKAYLSRAALSLSPLLEARPICLGLAPNHFRVSVLHASFLLSLWLCVLSFASFFLHK